MYKLWVDTIIYIYLYSHTAVGEKWKSTLLHADKNEINIITLDGVY